MSDKAFRQKWNRAAGIRVHGRGTKRQIRHVRPPLRGSGKGPAGGASNTYGRAKIPGVGLVTVIGTGSRGHPRLGYRVGGKTVDLAPGLQKAVAPYRGKSLNAQAKQQIRRRVHRALSQPNTQRRLRTRFKQYQQNQPGFLSKFERASYAIPGFGSLGVRAGILGAKAAFHGYGATR